MDYMFKLINDVNNINGDIMKNNNYHLFLLLTTFVRGLVETFSLVFLYKKGFNIDNILLFLFLMYLFGMIVNYISLKINYKIVLIISSLLYGISYIYLSYMNTSIVSLIIFSCLLSFSTYSYHCIRHYLALHYKIKNTSNIVNIMFIGIIISSILGTFFVSKLKILVISIILFILSFLSLIPIFKVDIKINIDNKKLCIGKRKILFNIFEQFKVIFLELQPLFLYLYINDSIKYVGWFNIIINISSLIVLFLISKKNIKNKFLTICLILSLVLFLKINITNQIILIIIAIIEGIFIKLYERCSLMNLYNIENNPINKYLLIEEEIFFGTKTLIIGIFLLTGITLKTIMILCVIGIIISGFIFKIKNKTNYT